MKKRSQAINTVWTVILTILSLAWVYPVVVVLINSFKKDSAISTNTAFQLPPADGFPGLGMPTQSIPRAFLPPSSTALLSPSPLWC